MLKGMIAEDIKKVFLSLNDFAEMVELDGVSIKAVVEEIIPDKGAITGGGRTRESPEGIFTRSLWLNISDTSALPTINRRVVLKFENTEPERWTVKQTIREGGMMRVRLEVVDS